MGARENLQKLADRKTQEIADLERQIELAKSYLQAIQDSMRAIPRDTSSINGCEEGHSGELRPGSVLSKARDAIKKNGKPMYVADLLAAIGLDNTKAARVSLVGSLGAYVRKGALFTRPAPNTFGLLEMKIADSEQVSQQNLPEDFGEIAEGD